MGHNYVNVILVAKTVVGHQPWRSSRHTNAVINKCNDEIGACQSLNPVALTRGARQLPAIFHFACAGLQSRQV